MAYQRKKARYSERTRKEPLKEREDLSQNFAAVIFIILLILGAIGALAYVIVSNYRLPAPPEHANAEQSQIVSAAETQTVEEDGGESLLNMADVHSEILVEEARAVAKKAAVKQVLSATDQEKYYVAANLPDEEKAADRLADLALTATRVLAEVKRRLEESKDGKILAGDNVDITKNMEVLLSKHYQKHLNLAEYHCADTVVGSSSNKGQLIEICLRHKKDTDTFNSINTTHRVFLHEVAHSADFEYRKDGQNAHGPVFRRLHAYLLGVAEDIGLYSCEDYQKSGGAFCGLNLGEKYCSSGDVNENLDASEDGSSAVHNDDPSADVDDEDQDHDHPEHEDEHENDHDHEHAISHHY